MLDPSKRSGSVVPQSITGMGGGGSNGGGVVLNGYERSRAKEQVRTPLVVLLRARATSLYRYILASLCVLFGLLAWFGKDQALFSVHEPRLLLSTNTCTDHKI